MSNFSIPSQFHEAFLNSVGLNSWRIEWLYRNVGVEGVRTTKRTPTIIVKQREYNIGVDQKSVLCFLSAPSYIWPSIHNTIGHLDLDTHVTSTFVYHNIGICSTVKGLTNKYGIPFPANTVVIHSRHMESCFCWRKFYLLLIVMNYRRMNFVTTITQRIMSHCWYDDIKEFWITDIKWNDELLGKQWFNINM